MWGPFIHAYTVHPPRPILKVSTPAQPSQSTGESKGELEAQSTAVESEIQKTPTEPQPHKTRISTMQDQQAEETVKQEGADRDDTSPTNHLALTQAPSFMSPPTMRAWVTATLTTIPAVTTSLGLRLGMTASPKTVESPCPVSMGRIRTVMMTP